MSSKDKVVAYFYDEECCNHNYGGGNPMRPHRVRLTTSLVNGYGLDKKLMLMRPVAQTAEDLTIFHADDYIDFLQAVTPDNQEDFMVQMRRFNLGPVGEADCPVFDDMFAYFRTYTGGSVGGAALLNKGDAQICLNWSGGMHHAKKAEASGFCYINDIVLAILELLKTHQRVLYVDIDIHHGDGVEEAFYTTNRVMTVSFHKYGDFFPGTGDVRDTGYSQGKHHSVNVPLREGMDDESYRFLFEPILSKVMEMYQPGAIVMCCGADSLSGDRLGCFNLSLQGHSNCIEFLSKYNVPLLVLGGGGYTMRNVARCWCYETGRLLGIDLPNALPTNALEEYNYYYDTHSLRINVSNMRNMNTRDQLEATLSTVLQNLAHIEAVPSVPIQETAPGHVKPEKPEEEMDVRGGGQAYEDERRTKTHDYGSDEEDDQKPARDHANAAEQGAPPPAAGPPADAAAIPPLPTSAPTTAPPRAAPTQPIPQVPVVNTTVKHEVPAAAEGAPPPQGAPPPSIPQAPEVVPATAQQGSVQQLGVPPTEGVAPTAVERTEEVMAEAAEELPADVVDDPMGDDMMMDADMPPTQPTEGA